MVFCLLACLLACSYLYREMDVFCLLVACTHLYAGEEGNTATNEGNEVNTPLWRSDAENALNDSTVACLERSATEA